MMDQDITVIARRKRIALVAHDHKKQDLVEWARFNRSIIAQHEIYATGTTGKLLELELGVLVHKLQSGPLGGIPTPTEVLGAMITPAVLISAAGTLVLSTSQRLSRVVDRIRVLAAEAERLQGPPGSTSAPVQVGEPNWSVKRHCCGSAVTAPTERSINL
jgi:hypothetical protein